MPRRLKVNSDITAEVIRCVPSSVLKIYVTLMPVTLYYCFLLSRHSETRLCVLFFYI